MKVAVTGATGTIGRRVLAALRERGDEPVVLSRDAASARERLGDVEAHDWRDPKEKRPPAEALRDCEGVVHLLGEPLDQRWSEGTKREIRDSRVLSTRNLVAALGEPGARLRVLVSQSASGYYGPRGDERVTEDEPPGDDFLAQVVVDWEAEARRAEDHGLRVVTTRTGVVLSGEGGALKRMALPFRLGIGGPVAGGRQYMPWIHVDDEAGAMLHLLDDQRASGPVNLCAPEPATNRELSKALGRVLRRPAIAPVPGFALRVLFGEMSQVVTTGVRMAPHRLGELGYRFRQPELEPALRSALGR
jgi:uncharacterized protein (TIGR01777 family)